MTDMPEKNSVLYKNHLCLKRMKLELVVIVLSLMINSYANFYDKGNRGSLSVSKNFSTKNPRKKYSEIIILLSSKTGQV